MKSQSDVYWNNAEARTSTYGGREVQRLTSVICHPSSVIRHPSSVIRHLSSVICHLSSVIRHPSFGFGGCGHDGCGGYWHSLSISDPQKEPGYDTATVRPEGDHVKLSAN